MQFLLISYLSHVVVNICPEKHGPQVDSSVPAATKATDAAARATSVSCVKIFLILLGHKNEMLNVC